MKDKNLVNKSVKVDNLISNLQEIPRDTRKASLNVYDLCIAAADRLANDQTHIAALQQEIDRLRAQVPRWIPVEERLPDVWRNDETAELVNYMIYSPDFGVDIGNYHAKAKKWLCMALPCTVTHWMPLPEPPEVEL